MLQIVERYAGIAYVYPLKHLPLKRFSELTGTTPAAIRSRIQRGDWAEGLQYRRDPSGNIQIILAGVDDWIENGI